MNKTQLKKRSIKNTHQQSVRTPPLRRHSPLSASRLCVCIRREFDHKQQKQPTNHIIGSCIWVTSYIFCVHHTQREREQTALSGKRKTHTHTHTHDDDNNNDDSEIVAYRSRDASRPPARRSTRAVSTHTTSTSKGLRNETMSCAKRAIGKCD
jgi:hypothetical protein